MRTIGVFVVVLALLSALHHLHGAGRAHADRPDPSGRRHASPRQCGDRRAAGRTDRPGDVAGVPSPPAWPGRCAAARADRRPVFGHRRGAGDPGGGGGERHARSRARSAVLSADAFADRKFVDRRRRLCPRACAVRAGRYHCDRHRTLAREAAVRSESRPVSPVPGRTGFDPRIAGGHAARQGPERDRAGRLAGQPHLQQAVAGRSRLRQRYRAAGRDVPRRELRRGHHQAARLSGHLPLHRPTARSARAGAAQRHPRGRRAICRSRSAPGRRAGRVRPDVHGDFADRAAVGGVDRAQLRQLPGRADPPPDRRRTGRRDRQSLCAGADPPLGRRPGAARRDLQQDDAGAAHPARRHRARPRPDRQPPPVHRGCAGQRQRRRDRRRCRGAHQHPQPFGRTPDRLLRDRGARPPAHRDRARARRDLRDARASACSGWCRAR